jgi:hypothetical protein
VTPKRRLCAEYSPAADLPAVSKAAVKASFLGRTNQEVAAFLLDQWTQDDAATNFLAEVSSVDPTEVRKSLLSAVDQFTVQCRMPQLQNSMTASTAPAEQSSVLLAAVS